MPKNPATQTHLQPDCFCQEFRPVLTQPLRCPLGLCLCHRKGLCEVITGWLRSCAASWFPESATTKASDVLRRPARRSKFILTPRNPIPLGPLQLFQSLRLHTLLSSTRCWVSLLDWQKQSFNQETLQSSRVEPLH